MYDYGARWYDPQLGRFISPDTIIPEPGNSQSFNRYAYVINNPLKYVDPSGHCWGFASGLRDSVYGQTCENLDMSYTIRTSPDTTIGQKVGVALYSGAVYGSHLSAFVGAAAASVGCLTGAGTVVCAGGAGRVVSQNSHNIEQGLKLGVKAAAHAVSADGDPTNEVRATTRVFWSGGDIAENAATAWAKANNATTLGMTETGQHLQEMVDDLSPLWGPASQEFAAGAEGPVHVFQNADAVFLQSFWATVEYQTLVNNPKVTEIIYHTVQPDGSVIIVP